MAYHVYLGDTEIPIPPEKIDLKISGNNKTLTLINDGEINILKIPCLTELSFEILLPQVQYPFAYYPNGFRKHSIIWMFWKNTWLGANRFNLLYLE